jgi:quinol monooxygenase YgiN
MITFNIIANVDLENQREFIQTSELVMKKTRNEKGCLSCHLVKDTEDEKLFLFMVEWKTREDLLRHICSDGFAALSGALDLLGNRVETKIHSISSTQGIEMLTKIRDQHESKKRRLLGKGSEQNIINRVAVRKVPSKTL